LKRLLLIGLPVLAIVSWFVFKPARRERSSFSKEPGSISPLHTLRSAVSVYQSDMEGKLPQSLGDLVPKYLPQISEAVTDHHPKTALITIYDDSSQPVSDTGGWGYNPHDGHVWINCLHQDVRGSVWSTW
jgi:hypothetical protein